MTWVRDRLLKELPLSMDRDARPTPGFSLAYDGDAWVTIERRRMQVSVQGGTGTNVTLDLEGKTIADTVSLLNAVAGFTAVALADDNSRPAVSLIEVTQQPVGREPRFPCFTSLLWRVLVPMSWALYDGVDIQERAARQSASIWSAEELWLNYWGELYGDARRRDGEEDAAFAMRIIHEVLRPKLNAIAIEQIIEEDLGVSARIRNLYQEAWEVGTTRKGRLAGRKYSRTTFEVVVSDLVDGLRVVVNKARAVGTYPFYRYQVSQGDREDGYATIASTVTHPQTLLSKYAWVVGRDRCRELPLGGKFLSLFESIGIASRSEDYFHVTSGTLGDPLIMGTGMLGFNVLGNPSAAGVLFSEGSITFIELGITEVQVTFEDQIVPGNFYLITFGVTIDAEPTSGPGESGWIIQSGWYLGVFNGVVNHTETPIAGAVPKDVTVNLSVVNGVLVYVPSV